MYCDVRRSDVRENLSHKLLKSNNSVEHKNVISLPATPHVSVLFIGHHET